MSTCISSRGEYSGHETGSDYVCVYCGVLDEDGLIAELSRLRALVVACSCGTSRETYEGPEADCPVHGAIRAYNEARAERDALRVGIQALIDAIRDGGRVGIEDAQDALIALLDRTSITGE